MKKILIVLAILAILIGIGGFLAFKVLMGRLQGKGTGGKIFNRIENLINEKVEKQIGKTSSTEEKNNEKKTSSTEEKNNEGKESTELIGKVNENIYIDVTARTSILRKLAISNKMDIDEAVKKIEDIYKKYDVTKNEIENYGTYPKNRPNVKSEELFQRVYEKSIELQNEYKGEKIIEKPIERGKMDNKMYIELASRAQYLGLYALGGEISENEAEKRMEEFYREYGITENEFKTFKDALSETKKDILNSKIQTRILELDEAEILGK